LRRTSFVFAFLTFTSGLITASDSFAARYQSMQDVLAEIDLPSKAAIKDIHSNGSYVASSGIDAFAQKQINFKCADKSLLPVSASQVLKDYHANYWVDFNHFALKNRDRACRIWNKQANSEGVINCLAPDVYEIVLMSSLYSDRCGNMYRAYWAVDFFKRDDNMGTLLAKGNTVYADQNSNYKGDFFDAHTFAVSAKDFLFFSAPTAADVKKAQVDRARVLKYTHDLNSDGTFSQKK
jgi:hypothetical protein